MAALFFVAIMAMASMGYQAGLSGSRRTMTTIFLTLAFSSILMLIAVLDQPEQSMRLISQQTMIDLQKDMNNSAP
jgi:preprotein translocase subunit SecG